MLRMIGYVLVAVTTGPLWMGTSASAVEGKISRCVDYANEAVEMQRRNIELGCGITGLRWHEWWDGHYGWCKDWVPPREVRHHTSLRREEIARCEDQQYSRHERRRGSRLDD